MRILLLATSFNALTQRIHVELAERGHDAFRRARRQRRLHGRGGAPVPAGSGDRAVPAPRHPGGGLAHGALPDRASRPGRRPRPGRARLGDPRRPPAWGTTLIEANADVRCRRHLGDPQFQSASGREIEPLSRRSHRGRGRLRDRGDRQDRSAASPTGQPLSEAEPDGGTWRPAIKIEERAIDWSSRRHRDRAAQAPCRVRPAGHSRHDPRALRAAARSLAGGRLARAARRGHRLARRRDLPRDCRRRGVDHCHHARARAGHPPVQDSRRRWRLPAASTASRSGRSTRHRRRRQTPFAKSPTARRTASAGLSFEFLNGAMSVDQCRRLLDAYPTCGGGQPPR